MAAPQVIIVGAGPTGLTLACQLQRYNIPFVILDKNSQTTHLSKAMVVHARSLEIFNEIGLAEKAIEIGEPARSFNMIARGKVRGHIEIANFGDGLSQFPFALILEQNKTEKLLAGYLAENNIPIQWNCEVLHLEENEEFVKVTYKDGEGREQQLTANYLAACDGASSLVRNQLKLSFEGDTQERTFYVADLKLDGPITQSKEAYFVMIKNGFALFFKMEGDRHYRVIGTIPEADTHKVQHFGDIKETIRKQIQMPIEFLEEYWFSTYKVHSRMSPVFRKGRFFLAGDAAHIHTPAGGQGMNTGIQDAYNLAWKLAFVIKGQAQDSLLDTYNDERVANAKNLLKSTDRLFDILAGTGVISNAIRLYVFPMILKIVTQSALFNRRIFPTLSMIGIHYPQSSLTVASKIGKIAAGDRFPYFLNNGVSSHELVKQPDFKLVCFGKNPQWQNLQSKLKIHQLVIENVPAMFGSESDFYIVLRPDNYIAYLGKDFKQINRALTI